MLCKPPNEKTSVFIQNLNLILDLFKKNYDYVTLIGDFNLSSNDVPLESFLQAYNLTNLIKEATCFQSSNPRRQFRKAIMKRSQLKNRYNKNRKHEN